MSAEIITLPGCASMPAAPIVRAEPSLIEPSVAPIFVSNVRPRVAVHGGLATIIFAALEEFVEGGGVGAVVQAKICVPADLLPRFAFALAEAGGILCGEPEKDGPTDGKTE